MWWASGAPHAAATTHAGLQSPRHDVEPGGCYSHPVSLILQLLFARGTAWLVHHEAEDRGVKAAFLKLWFISWQGSLKGVGYWCLQSFVKL